ncbi:MAG TPA: DNA-binding response regulator [Hyphomonadaceae bacterium]|nr:DNA-binding response regulator [Hyphomonadaceae bacterium]
MAKILVVEDDAQTCELLKRGLTDSKHTLVTAGDGEAALERLGDDTFEIVVLDVMLPRGSGWEVIAEMRRRGMRTPVLMLSALDSVESRVRGLALGADDYLTKPFSFEELDLRIAAICRRAGKGGDGELAFADLRLDERRMTAVRGETEIPLSAKETELLKLLLMHQGTVLSKNFIAAHVWDMRLDSDSNVVEVNIRRLRQRIDEPFSRKLIHTLRGRGYVIR